MAISSKFWVSNWESVHLMEVSVSISVSKLRAEQYQYQYRYQNFITDQYQYCISIEYSDLHSISIVSVSKRVVSKTSDSILILLDFLCFDTRDNGCQSKRYNSMRVQQKFLSPGPVGNFREVLGQMACIYGLLFCNIFCIHFCNFKRKSKVASTLARYKIVSV